MRQRAIEAGIPFSTFKRMHVAAGTYFPDQGRKGKPRQFYYPLELYLSGEKFITTHNLKIRLFVEGIKKQECETCHISEWLGEEVPLELDHIDRNSKNNSLENLQILCPLCHAIKTRKDRQTRKNRIEA